MKLALLFYIFIYSALLQAAIDPIYKECMQREYQVDGQYCIFPDSSRCLLEEFNTGKCGQHWLTDDYCVKEGRYIWDAERCCEGLVAYLPKGMAGQASCQPKSKVLSQNLTSGSPLLYVLLILGLLVGLLLLRRQAKGRRSS